MSPPRDSRPTDLSAERQAGAPDPAPDPGSEGGSDGGPAEPAASTPVNRLASETSAYLRQHMRNPVDWYPWGEEALARARAEDKPLLVSIGYSACHWCHVMERESFEDPEVAARMNRDFVNVKVDREERPDVDQIYMDTVVGLTGHGGWPLTVFCTPDGRPFHAGTYFPPEPRHGLSSFGQVLDAVHRAFREKRDQVEGQARQILDALGQRPLGVAEGLPGRSTLLEAARQLLRRADRSHGGFGGAPKFPTPTRLDLLLAATDEMAPEEAASALEFLRFSFGEMARRGCYDQLGGGFHRYCVDEHWGVPHFEKMLYDQGQLMRSYAELWSRSGGRDEELLWPIRETAAWLRREMSGPEGGLYASQDADSEGEEGRFYVWTPPEVEAVLGPELGARFGRAYAVTPEGNFEGRSVLWDLERAPRTELAEAREKLRRARAERVPPATDTKRLAAWNALAASGLALAGSLSEDEALLEDAQRVGRFLVETLVDDRGRLHRVFADGRVRIPGFLDDHAAVLAACLDLHRAGAGGGWLERALHFAEQLAERFYDADEADFFLSAADGERLAHRPRTDHDGATPQSTGLALLGLLRVAALTGREGLRRIVEQTLRTHAYAAQRSPLAYPTLLRAAALAERGVSVAVIVGAADDPARGRLASRARRALAPQDAVVELAPGERPAALDPSWLTGREPVEGRATAWVCRGTACSLPVTDPEALSPLAPAPAAR